MADNEEEQQHHPHHHHHDHPHNKKGSFLNKLFARQSSIKKGSKDDHADLAHSSLASSHLHHDQHHPPQHFPPSPLGSSAPVFPLRHLALTGGTGTGGGGGGGGGKGGGKEGGRGKGGGDGGEGGRGKGGERLPVIPPTAAAALKIALDYLGSVALEEEGLYRVSGNKLDVDRLKTVLEAGLLGSQEMLGVHYPDKHVVAGAVKKVLQEHEPLLGYDLYGEFLVAGAEPDDRGGEKGKEEDVRHENQEGGTTRKCKEGRYRELVQQLPLTTCDLLAHLLRHLRLVAAHSEVNRMTAENLAATIGVNLLRRSESVAGVTIQQLENERLVVMDLIALCPTLFPDDSKPGQGPLPPPHKPAHIPPPQSAPSGGRTTRPAPCHFFPLMDDTTQRGGGALPKEDAAGGREVDMEGHGPPPPLSLPKESQSLLPPDGAAEVTSRLGPPKPFRRTSSTGSHISSISSSSSVDGPPAQGT